MMPMGAGADERPHGPPYNEVPVRRGGGLERRDRSRRLLNTCEIEKTFSTTAELLADGLQKAGRLAVAVAA